MKKTTLTIFMVAVIVGGISFYGGLKYGQSKNSLAAVGAGRLANLSPEERQARMQQFADLGAGGARGNRSAGGVSNGEVIAKDDKSITVKLRDSRLSASGETENQGGSKIIFFSAGTPVSKTVNGSLGDVKIGEQISVSGTANSDGSITAQSIQIRPEQPQK